MKWFSKMKMSETGRVFADADRLENDIDEGSSSMFRILGPLSQRGVSALPQPVLQTTPVKPRGPYVRVETAAPMQQPPVKKLMKIFDDTACFNESDSLKFG